MITRHLPALRPLALAITTFTAASMAVHAPTAEAANAIIAQPFQGNATTISAPGGTLTAVGSASRNAYTDNVFLNNSAWAHTGAWWNFELTVASDIKVSVVATDLEDFAPGLTVWASGNSVFNGGTTKPDEISNVGINAPHSFNATGDIGDHGTLWMSGNLGNLKETLGNAIVGPSDPQWDGYDETETGWGEVMLAGAHDLSLTDTYESGVSGSVAPGMVELLFTQLQPGWYTIFVGGTDSALSGSPFTLSVASVAPVPVPAATYLLGSGVMALAGWRKRKRQA